MKPLDEMAGVSVQNAKSNGSLPDLPIWISSALKPMFRPGAELTPSVGDDEE
jgi:hypothetical protein